MQHPVVLDWATTRCCEVEVDEKEDSLDRRLGSSGLREAGEAWVALR